MSSIVLPPQGLLLQRSRTQFQHCPSAPILGFRIPTRAIPPRVSLKSYGFLFGGPVIAVPARGSFVVRTEEEVVAETESGDGEGEGEGDESVGVVDDGEVVKKKKPWKPRVKLGDVMGILNKRAVEARDAERPIPDIRTGDVVELKVQTQTKRRLAVYKGIVISRQNAGIHTTIRIRRIIAGVGVEIVFPLYSPILKEIKIIDRKKVRKARLYYLRDKLPRFSTFK
ncbi:Large ribosomal subunit protein bL19c-like protein [Drosera capensis]